MTHRPGMIITGGQTGADYGGLLAAKSLGIPTGGFAPKGFRTETGPRSSLATDFGLVETESSDYAERTRNNIEAADVVLIIASDMESRGTALTDRLANRMRRPVAYIHLVNPIPKQDFVRIRQWLDHYKPGVLMIAGNRESVSPGIEQKTVKFLREVFAT